MSIIFVFICELAASSFPTYVVLFWTSGEQQTTSPVCPSSRRAQTVRTCPRPAGFSLYQRWSWVCMTARTWKNIWLCFHGKHLFVFSSCFFFSSLPSLSFRGHLQRSFLQKPCSVLQRPWGTLLFIYFFTFAAPLQFYLAQWTRLC